MERKGQQRVAGCARAISLLNVAISSQKLSSASAYSAAFICLALRFRRINGTLQAASLNAFLLSDADQRLNMALQMKHPFNEDFEETTQLLLQVMRQRCMPEASRTSCIHHRGQGSIKQFPDSQTYTRASSSQLGAQPEGAKGIIRDQFPGNCQSVQRTQSQASGLDTK